jgi:hypothetical protein
MDEPARASAAGLAERAKVALWRLQFLAAPYILCANGVSLEGCIFGAGES